MATEPNPQRKILSYEDLLALISDTAQNGEGAAKTQAQRMLLSAQGAGGPAIPDIMREEEIVPRLAKLMLGAGKNLTNVAFHKAFPRSQPMKGIRVHNLHASDVVPEGWTFPKTLKQLYKKIPEIKRSGYPPGYPVGRSAAAKQEWIRRECIKYFADLQMAEVEARNKEELRKELDGTEGTAEVPVEHDGGTGATPDSLSD